jgi:TolB-like protein/class 3 adenylate cyclase
MASQVERRLAAILSADVVGYSRLMVQDEETTVRTIAAHRAEVERLVGRHRGRLVDFTGDNFLAEFPTASDAVTCAVETQRVLRALNETIPAERRMEFRIGIHLGEVRVEGERIYGNGVNIAARLESLAHGGGICISGAVHEQVRHRLQLEYRDMGEREVKNIPDPVRAFLVVTGDSPVPEPETPVVVRVLAGLGVVLLLVAFVAGWWLLARGPGPASRPGLVRSIAVLPLENLSGDPEQDYFADGMTEALIADIARIRSLRVISRTSVMQYKNARKPLPEIARELDVDAIIEGSVFRAGDRVRIVAQLIQASTDHHLWSETYERSLSDILSLQREVAQAIAQEVQIALTPEERSELSATQRIDPEAYEAYLRGRYLWNRRKEGDLEQAIAQFETVVALAPDSALGYAGLALAHDTQGVFGLITPDEAVRAIRGNVKRALDLDDTLAEVWTSLGDLHWWSWRWAEAEKAYRRAIELNPSYATAHDWLGYLLVVTGRFDKGLAEVELARRLDPLSATTRADACRAATFARRFDAALEHCRAALEIDPDHAGTRYALGEAYAGARRYDDALRELERAVDLGGGDEVAGLLGYTYGRRGDTAEASRLLDDLLRRTTERYVDPASIALVYAGLGDPGAAVEWLEKARDVRSFSLSWAGIYFAYDFVRNDPRFRDIVNRMGLGG